MSVHDANKKAIAPLGHAFRSGDPRVIRLKLTECFDPDAAIRLGYPLGEMRGPNALWQNVYAPLLSALPDMERADFIVMAGARWGSVTTENWVGLGGNFVGTFARPWLGIPATGRPVYFRYHEYLRLEGGKIVEMEALWDIPQLMLQAGVWPMPKQPGVEWMCPGPSTGAGVITTPYDANKANASVQVVWDMLQELKSGDAETPGRGLSGHWHPNAPWYGPTGIGSARGTDDLRDTILTGFRGGLSDNTRHLENGVFFGDHDFVAFTGWPSATATHSGQGFLGVPPTGKRFHRRSLDFWRIENQQVRENWVMVDILDIYRQLGIDVLAQMTESADAPARQSMEPAD